MFAIAGGKGGCGKTTTALTLGVALARVGETPLIVDADVDMPDLHLLADVDPSPNTDDVASGDSPRSVAQQSPRYPGVWIVAAGSVEELSRALARIRRWDGPVLLDCPAGASRDVAVPLRRSDRTLLVTTATPQSIEDTLKTAAIARELDAPPLVALVRAEDATGAGELFACPSRRLPTVEAAEVPTAPEILEVCHDAVPLFRAHARRDQ